MHGLSFSKKHFTNQSTTLTIIRCFLVRSRLQEKKKQMCLCGLSLNIYIPDSSLAYFSKVDGKMISKNPSFNGTKGRIPK